jgi:CheY-like chemotaxis protein
MNKNMIMKGVGDAKIVLITEYGESVPIGQWSALSLPIHAISIADVLNRKSDRYSYNFREESVVRFTAPDANVLIVDDINTNLKVANGLMLPYSMNVELCGSGMEAIEAVKRKRYDIVFMDHRMPGVDGVEATARIRKMGEEDPYFTEVPIIALTANAVVGVREMFLSNGFNEFMSKPIDTVRLNTILEKFVPKEKQIGFTTATRPSKKANEKLVIDGVDVDRGIMLTGGAKELYIETLTAFFADGTNLIDEIEKCVGSDDMNLYATYIHAIKSACATIGAIKVSDTAYALELAANENNVEFINKNNDSFMDQLGQLLVNIDGALAIHKR